MDFDIVPAIQNLYKSLIGSRCENIILAIDWEKKKAFQCGSPNGKQLVDDLNIIQVFSQICKERYNSNLTLSNTDEESSVAVHDLEKFIEHGEEKSMEDEPEQDGYEENYESDTTVIVASSQKSDPPKDLPDDPSKQKPMADNMKRKSKATPKARKKKRKKLSRNKSGPNKLTSWKSMDGDSDTENYEEENLSNCGQNFEVEGKDREESKVKEGRMTELKVNQCHICFKQLALKSTLRRHLLLHGEKNITCDICGKKFFRKEDVTKHMKNHQGRKKEKCSECGQIYSSDSLKHHLFRIHGIIRGKRKEVKRYICDICNVEFKQKFGLDRHKRSHANLKIFKCYVCKLCFSSQNHLNHHVVTHQMNFVFSCLLCGKQFDTDEALQTHKTRDCENLNRVGEEFECKLCTTIYTDKEIYEKHLVTHREVKVAKSTMKQSDEHSENTEPVVVMDNAEDDKVVDSYEQSDSAKVTHGNSKDEKDNAVKLSVTEEKSTPVQVSNNPHGHVCDLCGKKFQLPMALFKHKLLHDENGLYSCGVCDYVSKSKDNLTRHAKKHLEIKPYSCEYCGKGFTERNNLNLHLLSHTKERPHLCDDCGKTFRTAQMLRRHKRSHTGERPYKCQYCPKTFMTAEVLHNHTNIHLNNRTYVCDICGMSFNQKCSLYTHRKKHSGIYSHFCKECGKGCKSAAALKTHFVSKHLKLEDVESFGLKVYKCEVCKKLFADKNDLDIHSRIHTGEKPFKCQHCGRAFSDKSNMRTHEKLHSDTRPHSCNVCGKGFVLNRDLVKHMKKHHETKPSEEEEAEAINNIVENGSSKKITSNVSVPSIMYFQNNQVHESQMAEGVVSFEVYPGEQTIESGFMVL